ncbi:MAG: hypothetical protein GC205_06635 [Bacteroidetes bacterium]|nr:hypothetical protein [Bacteroidota bacterium]
MLLPAFPDWNNGVMEISWQSPNGVVPLAGFWRIPLADALSQGQLDAHTLQHFSGEGPPPSSNDLPEFLLRVALTPEGCGWRFAVVLEAERAFQISKVRLVMPAKDGIPDAMFCNGWQSWSESREFGITERMHSPRWIARKLFHPYGDGVAVASSGKPGALHSWSWTSWPAQKSGGGGAGGAGGGGAGAGAGAGGAGAGASPWHQPNNIGFLGSLNEQDAYTCFALQARAASFTISRDIPLNWEASEQLATRPRAPFARTLLALFWAEGEEHAVYEGWFQAMSCKARPAPALTTGWTSWYRHYNRISAALLEQEMQDLAQQLPRPEWFQIDDGWQPSIGDWTSTRPSFPHGLKPLADQAKALGFKPGLWLAPFVAEKRSELLRKHPEWAERDEQGNLVPAGFNPLWSGTFYALNPDHAGLRDHLCRVFETVLDHWGFEGLKLDFLYAAGIQHREGRSRATRMRSAMQFLRDAAGDRFLLGCGVPLAPAFGLVDACRIGADVHLAWEHRLLALLRNRERVSTRLAVLTAVGRRALNGRAFANDPDVYLMRRNDPDVKLSEAEQFTLLLVNRLFGSVLFHSDAPADYPDAARTLLQNLLLPTTISAVRVLSCPAGETLAMPAEQVAVAFLGEGLLCLALLNLSDAPWSTRLETWCGVSGKATPIWYTAQQPVSGWEPIRLAPHHSSVFRLQGY